MPRAGKTVCKTELHVVWVHSAPQFFYYVRYVGLEPTNSPCLEDKYATTYTYNAVEPNELLENSLFRITSAVLHHISILGKFEGRVGFEPTYTVFPPWI